MYLRTFCFLPFILLSSVLSQSCALDKPESHGYITNGKKTSDYHAVVNLTFFQHRGDIQCTGTFMTDALLVTAAHCFDSHEGNHVEYRGVRSLSYRVHPQHTFYLPGYIPNTARDLAFVLFPKGTSLQSLPQAEAPAQVGTRVTLVGFGSVSTVRQVGEGIKRVGESRIVRRERGFYETIGNPGATDEEGPQKQPIPQAASTLDAAEMIMSAIEPGDSGGPLLDASGLKILGVTSSFGVSSEYKGAAMSYFADLLEAENQEFLEQTRKLWK